MTYHGYVLVTSMKCYIDQSMWELARGVTAKWLVFEKWWMCAAYAILATEEWLGLLRRRCQGAPFAGRVLIVL
jgi:hypothetical protein